MRLFRSTWLFNFAPHVNNGGGGPGFLERTDRPQAAVGASGVKAKERSPPPPKNARRVFVLLTTVMVSR